MAKVKVTKKTTTKTRTKKSNTEKCRICGGTGIQVSPKKKK